MKFNRMMVLPLALMLLNFTSPTLTQDLPFNPLLGVCTQVSHHALVAKAGFDYIEEGVQRFLVPLDPDSVFQKNLGLARNASVPVLACNGFLPSKFKSTGPVIHHNEILAYADTAFRRAAMAGVKIIVFGSSGSRNYPEGFDHETALRQFNGLLAKMGPLAQQYGIIVAIEPLQKSESNLINLVSQASAMAIDISNPGIKVLGDIFHMMRENEQPASLIEAGQNLVHMHMAELEKRTAPGIAGDNFLPYLKALRDAGYQGMISVEASWGSDFESNLIRSNGYLRGQLNAMDQ